MQNFQILNLSVKKTNLVYDFASYISRLSDEELLCSTLVHSMQKKLDKIDLITLGEYNRRIKINKEKEKIKRDRLKNLKENSINLSKKYKVAKENNNTKLDWRTPDKIKANRYEILMDILDDVVDYEDVDYKPLALASAISSGFKRKKYKNKIKIIDEVSRTFPCISMDIDDILNEHCILIVSEAQSIPNQEQILKQREIEKLKEQINLLKIDIKKCQDVIDEQEFHSDIINQCDRVFHGVMSNLNDEYKNKNNNSNPILEIKKILNYSNVGSLPTLIKTLLNLSIKLLIQRQFVHR